MMPSNSHIVPLLIGDAKRCREVSRRLLEEFGMYATPINYPTVPRGSERLRFTPGPFHTDAMMDRLIAASWPSCFRQSDGGLIGGTAIVPRHALERPLLRLKQGEGRRLRAGSPWAFSNEIAMRPEHRQIPPGSLVRLEGDDGWRFGTFMFNPHSLIAARRLDRDPSASIGIDWMRARLQDAIALEDAQFATRRFTGSCMPRRTVSPAW